MSEHPQYRMWKDKADQEYEWAEQRRVEIERQADMGKRLAEVRIACMRWQDEKMLELHDERTSCSLPWWDLLGRLQRWLP